MEFNTEHEVNQGNSSFPVLQWKNIKLVGNQPKSRYAHRAVAIGDYMIIFGGENNEVINQLLVYNTINNQWYFPEINGDLLMGHSAHSIVVYDNKLLLFGGLTDIRLLSNNLYELNTIRLTWKKLQPRYDLNCKQPCPRIGHSFTLIGKKVYLFGGLFYETLVFDHLPQQKQFLNDFYSLDISSPDALSWDTPVTIGKLPSPRESHSAVAYTNSRGKCKLVIYGGMNGLQLADLWILNIDTMTWSNPIVIGLIPPPRFLHTAVVLNQFMYVFGGIIKSIIKKTNLPLIEQEYKCTNQLYILNLETMQWNKLYTTKDSIPKARAGHCAVLIRSRMYIWSGQDSCIEEDNLSFCNDLWYLEIKQSQKYDKVSAFTSQSSMNNNNNFTLHPVLKPISKLQKTDDPVNLLSKLNLGSYINSPFNKKNLNSPISNQVSRNIKTFQSTAVTPSVFTINQQSSIIKPALLIKDYESLPVVNEPTIITSKDNTNITNTNSLISTTVKTVVSSSSVNTTTGRNPVTITRIRNGNYNMVNLDETNSEMTAGSKLDKNHKTNA